jgi:selenophosphate synthetase-related protein
MEIHSSFTNQDISIIKSILERNPTKKELQFIASAIHPMISKRHFISFSQITSFKNTLMGNDDTGDHFSFLSAKLNKLSIYNLFLKQLILKNDITFYGLNHHQEDSLLLFNEMSKIGQEFLNFDQTGFVNQYHKNNYDEKIFLISKGNKFSNTISHHSSIYLITYMSNSLDSQFRGLANLVNKLNENTPNFCISIPDDLSPLLTILNLMMDQERGLDIKINRESDINSLISKSGIPELIIIGNKGIFNQISLLNDEHYHVINLGSLISNDSIKIQTRNTQLYSFPKSIFRYLWRADNSTVPSIKNQKIKISEREVNTELNGNKALLKILKAINRNKLSFKPNFQNTEKNIFPEKIFWSKKSDKFGITFSEASHYTKIDPDAGGKIAVANAVRSLWCTGVKPKYIFICNNVSSNSELISDCVRLNESYKSTSKHFNLKFISNQFELDSQIAHQTIGVLGELFDKVIPPTLGFCEEDHFISILGSHRGELKGSVFESCYPKRVLEHPIKIDLNMELKLGEVIQLSLERNLIQTATNVSRGGLATALVSNLNFNNKQLGARIHLSRKVKPEELLFGETQGLILISLKEEDIMEFERICMNFGVPSTTIGRVTNTGKFTFNDMIDIPVEKIIPFYE